MMVAKYNPIDDLDTIRQKIKEEIKKGEVFSIPAKFSGGQCICGDFIEEREPITIIPLWNKWIHEKCANKERLETKDQSKAAILTNKLAVQAINKEAVWREDLIDLAKLTFLGKWSVDHWIADQMVTTKILDMFGLHKLTTGYRFGSDKMMRKYAQKIEKEFAKRKGWICRRCRRLIWVEKSVELGIGPVCYKHSVLNPGGKEE